MTFYGSYFETPCMQRPRRSLITRIRAHFLHKRKAREIQFAGYYPPTYPTGWDK